jgi:hypothetical protein
MRVYSYLAALAVASFATGAAAADRSGEFLLKPVTGGGYAIERRAPAGVGAAHGLATIADLVPLLHDEAASAAKIDFTAGQKLDGVFTVLVGRDDGTLGKYEGASDVVIFATPSSLTTSGDLTTLAGAVVFALKIDNAGAASAVQRFETGAITLSRVKKSL